MSIFNEVRSFEIQVRTTFIDKYFLQDGKTELQFVQPKFLSASDSSSSASGASKVVSPMPGILDKVLVKAGDRVTAGEPVAVIIAMKMEHVLKAPRDGVVKSVSGAAGSNVAKGAAVVTFVDESEDDTQQ